MRTRAYKSGFTLIEMLLVVAIIAILVSMVVGIAKRIDDQSKERLCRNSIALLGNALEQFRDFGYEYKGSYATLGFTFPIDCNNFSITNPNPDLNIEDVLRNAIYPLPPPILSVNITGAYDSKFSGSAALYFILSQVPDCRATLDKIDKSLLTNNGTDGNPMTISIEVASVVTATYPCTRIVDPWKTPLRYDYYPDFADYVGTWTNYLDYRNSAKKTFPVITSAGPDKQFDTADDISNVK